MCTSSCSRIDSGSIVVRSLSPLPLQTVIVPRVKSTPLMRRRTHSIRRMPVPYNCRAISLCVPYMWASSRFTSSRVSTVGRRFGCFARSNSPNSPGSRRTTKHLTTTARLDNLSKCLPVKWVPRSKGWVIIVQYERKAEFDSRFWSPDDSRYLDFSWCFDLNSDHLIVLPNSVLHDIEPCSLTRQINDFSLAVIDSLIALEEFARRVAIQTEGENSFHCLEEERHVSSFGEYRLSRWGSTPSRAGKLRNYLSAALTNKPEYSSLIGDYLIEGLALSLVGFLHTRAADPLLVRMCSFIIADELAHEPHFTGLGESVQSADGLDMRVMADLVSDVVDLLHSGTVLAFEWGCDQELTELLLSHAPPIKSQLLSLGVSHLHLHPLLSSPAMDGSTREFVQWVADDAVQFLSQLNSVDTPIRTTRVASTGVSQSISRRSWRDVPLNPPAALALEWLVAGLRSLNRSFPSGGQQ